MWASEWKGKLVRVQAELGWVIIGQLLAFTGGIAGYERMGPKITPELFDVEGTLAERELRFIKHVLQLPPAGQIGKEARYSNASYMLAAYIAAKATGLQLRLCCTNRLMAGLSILPDRPIARPS